MGGVFVITLAVLVGLVGILVAAAATQRAEVQALTYRVESRRAELLAQSAVARAIAAIANDTTPDATSQEDEWFTVGDQGSVRFRVGDDSFRMEIVDLSSRINLNTAPEAQLQRLPLTTEQIDSLLDWREATRTARTEGAKDDYYLDLPKPYNTALRLLESVDELLLVKGFTPETLYDPPTNTTSSVVLVQGSSEDQPPLVDLLASTSASTQTSTAGARINVNGPALNPPQLVQLGIPLPVALQIVQRRGTFTSIGQVVALSNARNVQTAMLDRLTTSAAAQVEGKINLNTATEAVLNSLPGMTPDVATAILSRQTSGGFTKLSDVLDVPGLTGQVLQQTVGAFSTQGQRFSVRIEATVGGRTIYREALISRDSGTPKCLRWSTPAFSDMETRWNWPTSTTNETVLVEATK
ncbi:MAG: general secretion pathway protein GspK [Fimbriimonas sp.]